MLHHLVFDTTDAQSIQDSHSVGAHIRAGQGGALVSYHGSVQANATTANFADTDVTPAADTITLTGHGFFTGDKIQFTTAGTLPAPLSTATDYWVIRVDANTIKVAASQSDAELGFAIDLTDAGAGSSTITAQAYDVRALDTWVVNDVLVHAVNLDIRDLVAATDSVSSWTQDGTGTAITSTTGTGIYAGKQGLDVSLISPITVDTDIQGVYNVSTNPNPSSVGNIFNTRGATPDATTQVERETAATATSDGVVAANVHGADVNSFNMLYNGTTWDRWQGTGGSADVNVTNTITTSDAALANTAIAANTTSLTTAGTAQAAVASPLANRKYLWLYNNTNKNMYVGPTGVTSGTGFPLPPGTLMEMRAGAAVGVDVVASINGADLRHMELS